MKRQYQFIDLFKILLAIGIVLIHTGIIINYENGMLLYIIFNCFVRLGVPFFFIASGFFYGIKLIKSNNYKEVLKKSLKRLFLPFLFWLIIDYFPLRFFTINSGNVFTIIIKTLQMILFYPWGGMWYILALIVAIIIITLLYKKNKMKEILICSAILYLFALLCNNYYFITNGSFF